MTNENALNEAKAYSYSKMARNSAAASGTARNVSRVLRAAGFEMSTKVDKWSVTRGLSVSRVGCGNKVSLYFSSGRQAWGGSQERKDSFAAVAAGVDFLRSKGFAFDDRGWLEVEPKVSA